MTNGIATKPGWLYWVIGVLALLWNAFGCLDYTMTATRNPAWMAQMTPAMVDWLDAAPGWTMGTWALGVWGGLVGALLLLLRSRWAVLAFAASLAGLAANQAWQWNAGLPQGMDGTTNLVLTAIIWIVAIALLWHAIGKRRAGVLR